MPEQIRPTKKQRELLTHIERFIAEHGYSPSYREIMHALNYTSVATVALHVNNLIKRGHLRKRDRSARSLEVVQPTEASKVATNAIDPNEEKWLVDKIDYHFTQAENAPTADQSRIDELYVLVGALKVLGLDGAATAFIARLSLIRQKVISPNPDNAQ